MTGYNHFNVVPRPLPPIELAAGTAAAPGLTFTGSNATGFYSSGGNTLSIVTNGTERWRLDAVGNLLSNGAAVTSQMSLNSGNCLFSTTNKASGAVPPHWLQATAAGLSMPILQLDATPAASATFQFLILRANVGASADQKFVLRGDGNAFADGAWTGGGADYAEYFEWLDGNPEAEDRRGFSVVLEGRFIRPAQADDLPDDIIGVVSSNPTVVGDAAWNGWNAKYLRDAFGTPLSEDYQVVEWVEGAPDTGEGRQHSYAADAIPEGITVPDGAVTHVRQRPVLNPDFDPSRPYRQRADRPEWAAIGIMGKLSLRAGQPVGTRWIRLRAIGSGVDEWLVR